MSIRKTMITMAIMVTALVILAGVLHATPPRSSRLFDWKLEQDTADGFRLGDLPDVYLWLGRPTNKGGTSEV